MDSNGISGLCFERERRRKLTTRQKANDITVMNKYYSQNKIKRTTKLQYQFDMSSLSNNKYYHKSILPEQVKAI